MRHSALWMGDGVPPAGRGNAWRAVWSHSLVTATPMAVLEGGAPLSLVTVTWLVAGCTWHTTWPQGWAASALVAEADDGVPPSVVAG